MSFPFQGGNVQCSIFKLYDLTSPLLGIYEVLVVSSFYPERFWTQNAGGMLVIHRFKKWVEVEINSPGDSKCPFCDGSVTLKKHLKIT